MHVLTVCLRKKWKERREVQREKKKRKERKRSAKKTHRKCLLVSCMKPNHDRCTFYCLGIAAQSAEEKGKGGRLLIIPRKDQQGDGEESC
mmetsp:Transcript_32352/g.64238  ORF Transcript_32352/g.64238 Transcript_32352/m.64238 type:complete len:90 (-) Transcript_32352:1761-2030(-)